MSEGLEVGEKVYATGARLYSNICTWAALVPEDAQTLPSLPVLENIEDSVHAALRLRGYQWKYASQSTTG